MAHIIKKQGIMTISGWTDFHPQMGDVDFHTDEFCEDIKEYYSFIGKLNQQVDGIAFIQGIHTYKNWTEKSDSSLLIPVKVQVSVIMGKPQIRT